MRILVADDHPLFRAALRPILDQLGEESELIETDNFADTKERLNEEDNISLVTLDLKMWDFDCLRSISMLRKLRPDVPIVVISN